MADRSSNEDDQDPMARIANDDTATTVLPTTHALAERLTAMVNYFAVARANISKGEYDAADQLIARFLDQSDRMREVTEQLLAALRKRLP